MFIVIKFIRFNWKKIMVHYILFSIWIWSFTISCVFPGFQFLTTVTEVWKSGHKSAQTSYGFYCHLLITQIATSYYTANHKKGYSCSMRYFSWKKWLINSFFVRNGKSIIKWSQCHKSHEFLPIISDFMIKRR